MLSMGFQEDIEAILEQPPEDAADAAVLRDGARGTSSAWRRRNLRNPEFMTLSADHVGVARDPTLRTT